MAGPSSRARRLATPRWLGSAPSPASLALDQDHHVRPWGLNAESRPACTSLRFRRRPARLHHARDAATVPTAPRGRTDTRPLAHFRTRAVDGLAEGLTELRDVLVVVVCHD